MRCELDVLLLVRDLFIVCFFVEPVCEGESLPTRTVLVLDDHENNVSITVFNEQPISRLSR